MTPAGQIPAAAAFLHLQASGGCTAVAVRSSGGRHTAVRRPSHGLYHGRHTAIPSTEKFMAFGRSSSSACRRGSFPVLQQKASGVLQAGILPGEEAACEMCGTGGGVGQKGI